ncbi:MAG: 2-haloacid dehalogenase [Solirubrobacteraceae bacterium]|jgi:2-haloacid dehalogenase|nr:2-haloacid dehalogenase [Solirubrobacteraceae bacterium]
MAATWVFDVNETLLDLRALDGAVFGGDAALRGRWFSQMIQCALVTTLLGGYRPFGELGAAALAMVAPEASPDALRSGLASLPPHPDVRPALEALRGRGDRLAALTQSKADVLAQQLGNAGIEDLFDAQFSADDAGRLKPAPAPYRYACAQLGVAPGEATMVAAHAWDVAGAAAAGLQTVLVARPGVVPDPSQPAPGRVVETLAALP